MLAFCAALAGGASAAEPAPTGPAVDAGKLAAQLKPVPPKEPADALALFKMAPGYHIELLAAEPMVLDPVAMRFDEDGRLWVVEMIGYPEDRDDRLSRIRVLEDTNGDSVIDKATVFADKLGLPTAVFPWNGGVFVGDAPDIFYMKDTDGDGRADQIKKVFTGMGDLAKLNMQTLVNSFRWGLDNRIYACGGRQGSVLPVGDEKAEPIKLRSLDFAFDPRTMEAEPVSGGAQYGNTFSDWGRRMTCVNTNPYILVVYEHRYARRNPYLKAPSAMLTVGEGGSGGDCYRISKPEAFRQLRTKMRMSGQYRGPLERGFLDKGFFTGICSTTFVRGDAYEPPMRGAAIVAETACNLVHRQVFEDLGPIVAGKRMDVKSEWIASPDNWFLPAHFSNAPDGTIWMADMYREICEHPWSLPDIIKQHIDLRSGRDRGRIYRIVPDGYRQRAAPKLSKATTSELVALLAHDNGWHRTTAARLIYQRQDREAIKPLQRLVSDSKSPLGRMHALYALDGLGALETADVSTSLNDPDPRVRQHAVRLSERLIGTVPQLLPLLYALVDDSDGRVQFQLAFTLGEVRDPGRLAALAAILKRHCDDPWMNMAALSSLEGSQHQMLTMLASDQAFVGSDSGRSLVGELARQVGARKKRAEVAVVLGTLGSIDADRKQLRASILQGLGSGMGQEALKNAMATDSGGRDALASMLADAGKAAADGALPVARRVEAIAALTLGSYDRAAETLGPLLDPRQPAEVQTAAVNTLTGFVEPGVAKILIETWPKLGPGARPAVLAALFARKPRTVALLDALRQKKLATTDLPIEYAQRLLNHQDKAIAADARQLLQQPSSEAREKVVARYQKETKALTGDVERGKLWFMGLCSNCHKVEGVGVELASDLLAFLDRGRDAMLLNVLNPNAEIHPQYVNYEVQTTDGRTLTGIIVAETPASITFTPGGGVLEELARSEIQSMRSTGRSIMPEGLEAGLPPQSMADLIDYLESARAKSQE